MGNKMLCKILILLGIVICLVEWQFLKMHERVAGLFSSSQVFTYKQAVTFIDLPAEKMDPNNKFHCYFEPGNLLAEIKNKEVKTGEAIFFHETSCKNNLGDFPLNARQACAVESAALAHYEKDVFLLITSPINVEINKTNNKAMHGLISYKNIHIRHIDFKTYITSTPMKNLNLAVKKDQWSKSHANDILPYATLHKYGGIYLDMDVIVLKELPQDISYTGAESEESLSSAVMRFGNDEAGLEVANSCTQEIITRSFRTNAWGNDRPGILDKVMQNRCGNKTVKELWDQDCKGFHIFSPNALYSSPPSNYRIFFNPKLKDNRFNDSYLIHYWRGQSSSSVVNETSRFFSYPKKYCPNVFEAVNGIF